MVLATEEVRWFYPGAVPADVRAWFLAFEGRVVHESPRIDHYLLVRDTDALGIKFREGRIEVKQRFGPPRDVSFGADQVGAVERWRKWGFSLVAAAERRAELEALSTWIAVEKIRMSRDYRLGAKGRLRLLEEPDLTVPTCSVELTEVHAEGHSAWTVAFESAGPADTLTPTLEQVARQILASGFGGRLRRQNSYGYARWLQITHG